ncbi:MAG: hypothetical protein GYA50_06325 [Eubacteriaceae bacterium]|nr:hypothetical protein [Eubacteriaceae bacterium]
MKKTILGVLAVIAILSAVGILYSNSYIRRDVPVLVDKDNDVTQNVTQANISSYDDVCDGIIYDINDDNDKFLVTLPIQTDIQTGLQADKSYMSVNLFNSKTSQMRLFNFDLTDHVSACFDKDIGGVFYISSDKNQNRKLLYTTIDGSKTKTIAGKEEYISTGVVRSGDYVIYGTSDGKIKLADKDGNKKILYEMDDRFTIKKVRYFSKSQLCIVQAENKSNSQTPLFMIDTAAGDIKVIDNNVEDFDANESSYSIVYISKLEDENQVYLYDIFNAARKFEKSGLMENVFFNDAGDMIAYIERVKKEATAFNIGLIEKNGVNNIRIISDVKLSNKKIIFKGENTIYYSELVNLSDKTNSVTNIEYKVEKCVFSL